MEFLGLIEGLIESNEVEFFFEVEFVESELLLFVLELILKLGNVSLQLLDLVFEGVNFN